MKFKVCLKQPAPVKGQQIRSGNWNLNSLHCDLSPTTGPLIPTLLCLTTPFFFSHSLVVTSTYFSLPPGFHCSQFLPNPHSSPALFSARIFPGNESGLERESTGDQCSSLPFPQPPRQVTRAPVHVLRSPASGDASAPLGCGKVGTAAARRSIQPACGGQRSVGSRRWGRMNALRRPATSRAPSSARPLPLARVPPCCGPPPREFLPRGTSARAIRTRNPNPG